MLTFSEGLEIFSFSVPATSFADNFRHCDKADWDEADSEWCRLAGKTITGGGEIEKKTYLDSLLYFCCVVGAWRASACMSVCDAIISAYTNKGFDVCNWLSTRK